MKISKKKSFFSTLNQYFSHIPYVASKNWFFGLPSLNARKIIGVTAYLAYF
jgi:hypothetical protein